MIVLMQTDRLHRKGKLLCHEPIPKFRKIRKPFGQKRVLPRAVKPVLHTRSSILHFEFCI